MKSRAHSVAGPRPNAARRPLAVAAAGVVGALVLCAVARSAQAKPEVTDSAITRAIESEFRVEDTVEVDAIDIQTREGIVSLSGTVGSILARERAESIAEGIVGVRGIVNRIEVSPPESRSDAEIRRAVIDAHLLDPATDSYELTVEVDDGIVTLIGTVDSWQEKKLCSTVAKGIKGVRDVSNDIEVEYKSDRPDSEIDKEIVARLQNDVLIDDHLVKVSVQDGKVTLSGTVGSLAEKRRAKYDSWVAGVSGVDGDDLAIKWWARDEMRRFGSGEPRSDEELKEAVKDAFLYDPRVLSFNPTVEVEGGTVTLTGIVDNVRSKRAAEQDSRNVVGVWRVKNYLKVRPTTVPTNDDLERRVATALREDPFVSRWDIGITVYSGTVYLSGDVDSSFEKGRAERVAEGVKGVVEVVNTIDHNHEWIWKADQEIREDVKYELLWSPFVDETKITVAVDDGIVTLTGEVDTWSERSAAVENAFEGGAKDVRDKLIVKFQTYGPRAVGA